SVCYVTGTSTACIYTLPYTTLFRSFIIGLIVSQQDSPYIWPITIGSLIIMVTGILDDAFDLRPKYKLIGQLLAALVVIRGGLDRSEEHTSELQSRENLV